MIDIEKLKSSVVALVPQYTLTLVVLFGSQARGDTNALSDIDVGIATKESLSPLVVAQISSTLSQAMGREVEVSQIIELPPLLQRNVIDDGILLYEQELGWFDRFAVYVYALYWDSKQLLTLRRNYLQEVTA